MPAPVQAGDRAEVISGVMRDKSPNLGLIVKVLRYVGDDPTFGRIFRCEAEYAEQWRHRPEATVTKDINVPPGTADFAQDWLRKIEPPPQTHSTTTETSKTNGVTA